MLSISEHLQKVICYQKLDQMISNLEFWRSRIKLKAKLLFVYKEYSLHHELYAMIRFLKKNYTNVDYVGFSPVECPRENPGLSSKKLFKKRI